MPVDLSLTMGYVVRHAPSKGAGGYEAALIDIAQDLLLRELHTRGITEHLAFKGGTALRKLYAGGEGRSRRISTSPSVPPRKTRASCWTCWWRPFGI